VSTPASALGRFIREQRQLARLSLREVARMSSISNAYLSQVERGLHEPSLRVLRSVAEALELPVEELYLRSAPEPGQEPGSAEPAARDTSAVETAIREEPRLGAAQKEALLTVFRGFLQAGPDS
jgi:transcriptional regulator with XRE-family HTH domain